MSRVMLTEECPSISETIFGFTSLLSRSVAHVCRRSWKRICGTPARSTAEALLGLSDIAEEFERGYLAMLTDVLARGLPAAICIVYYPRFPDAALQKVAVAALLISAQIPKPRIPAV